MFLEIDFFYNKKINYKCFLLFKNWENKNNEELILIQYFSLKKYFILIKIFNLLY